MSRSTLKSSLFNRKLTLEVLEDRTMLTASSYVPDGTAISYMDAALRKLIQDPLTSNYQGNWVVGIADGQNAAQLSVAAGATRSTATGIIDNAYKWTFTEDLSPTVISGWLNARKNAGQIAYFYPLLLRTVTPRLTPDDPRYSDQWHLNNTGQGGGQPGIDANVQNVWNNYTGAGVQIAVVDTGVNINHEDLSPNLWVNPNEMVNGLDDDGNGLIDDFNGWDFNADDADPTPEISDHGTSVAGVSAARGNNNTGVVGAAFDAELIGIRLIEGGIDDATEAAALSYQRSIVDIYNNSWGPSDDGFTLEGPGPLTLAALASNYVNGRNGLGNIYTWAGGNGGDFDNSNYDGYANSRFVIGVAAIGNNGFRASYSERGSNILVSAPSNGGSLGITTTAGLNTSDYTNGFGGTSSASPLVAGVIALILEARPDLTARDVQYILVNSSRQIDVADPGWFQNNGGAGFWYNDKYGYGMIDADAAVSTALAWTKVRPQINSSSGLVAVNQTIDPDFGLSVNFDYTGDDMPLEHVELVINATHTWRGDLHFTLTSPSGTVSEIQSRVGSDSNIDYVNWKFMTVANWGESPLGTWTLTITDEFPLADTGILQNFQLNFFGEGPPVPPTANDDFYTMQEDGFLFVPTPGVLGNDLFASTAQLVTGVGTGFLNLNPSGSFIYVPPANFFGTVSFTYQAINQDGISLPATVTITVNPVNDLPVANNDGIYIARPGYNFTLNAPGVLANDTDVDNPLSSLTASLFTSTFRGDITLNPNGSFNYLAVIGTGVDNFQYRVSDGIGTSSPATVTIRLNSPPVVQSANVFTEVGVAASGNVLTGATDLDGNSFTAALLTSPVNGSLTLNPNGTFTYTPNAGFFGIDTFQFRANDLYFNATPDQVGNTGTITIRVNRKPVTAGDSYNGKQGEVMEIFSPGILSNDTDLDTPLFGDVVRANLVSGPANGSLILDPNGYFKYVPNPTFAGTDSFTYRTFDGISYGNTATVTLQIAAVPIANPDSYFTLGTSLNVAPGAGVLANDFSPNITPLSAKLITPPIGGTLTLEANGGFTYIAATGFSGLDTFTYVANDGLYDSLPATVSITVFALTSAPTAVNDSYTTAANTPLNVLPAGVLSNDTDPQGAILQATIVSGTSNGTLQLNFDGSFLYTPLPGFNGVDSFTYQASNGSLLSNVATVSITVGSPPPVVLNPSHRIIAGKETGGELKVLAGETGAVIFTLKPYGNTFNGAIRVATGDVNADGVPDIITAPGAGSGGTGVVMGIRVFNGVTGTPFTGVLGTGIRPFGTSYTGGIQVAAGDLNGDGRADIVAGADTASTTNQVKTFNGANGNAFTAWYGNIKPYTGTAFGGVRVATGDVNGDGRAEIITAPGAGVPTVRVYNPAAANVTAGLIRSFSAYSSNVAGGVFVAAGDLNGDGTAEIVTGAAANSNGHIRVFNGSTGAFLRNLNLGTGTSGPARVALGDINGDGRLDLVVGQTFTGQASKARVYDAVTMAEMFVGDPRFTYGGGYTGGLFVASLAKINGPGPVEG